MSFLSPFLPLPFFFPQQPLFLCFSFSLCSFLLLDWEKDTVDIRKKFTVMLTFCKLNNVQQGSSRSLVYTLYLGFVSSQSKKVCSVLFIFVFCPILLLQVHNPYMKDETFYEKECEVYLGRIQNWVFLMLDVFSIELVPV